MPFIEAHLVRPSHLVVADDTTITITSILPIGDGMVQLTGTRMDNNKTWRTSCEATSEILVKRKG